MVSINADDVLNQVENEHACIQNSWVSNVKCQYVRISWYGFCASAMCSLKLGEALRN